MLRTIIHYSMHLLAPALIARIAFPNQWKRAWIIMLATMLVDLDHLLATPIFDPMRCSIGFHPLHSCVAIGFYFILLIPKPTRIVAVGLIFHMLTDTIDCYWNLSQLPTPC